MKPNLIHRPSESSTKQPPLLFVHGAFAGAWCWEEHFMPFFCDVGYDCYALDLRGHGNDDAACPWLHTLGIRDYVRDLQWALKKCPRPPVVVAHSMGGFVTLKLLQRERWELAGLVLMSPASPNNHFNSAIRMYFDFPVLCYKLNLMNAVPKGVWPWLISVEELRTLLLSDATSLQTPDRLLPKLQHESYLAMFEMLQPSYAKPPHWEFPAIVICGSHDAIVATDIVRETSQWLATELRVLPNLGHALMLEDGWLVAAETISNFLGELDERSAAGSFAEVPEKCDRSTV
jgi:pimeloyl-ACP methyl ester carboxylesterase